MLMAALIINMGTMQAWRLRGEVAARNAAWEARWPRNDGIHSRMPNSWRSVSAAAEHVAPPAVLDPGILNQPVVRGPLPPATVLPLFEPGLQASIIGHGRVVRRTPMIRGARPYDSSDIRHPLLDGTWSVREMGLSSATGRRTLDLYIFPVGAMP
jgi:hypothetical protein